MAEICALRGQLEQSIQVNNRLRLQLEQQMEHDAGTASLRPSPAGQSCSPKVEPENPQPLFPGSAASPPVRDIGLNSAAMVLPSSSCSDPAIITRTNNGKYSNERTQVVMGIIDANDLWLALWTCWTCA